MRGYSLIDRENQITGSLKIVGENTVWIKIRYPREIQDEFVGLLVQTFREIGFQAKPLYENYSLGMSSRQGIETGARQRELGLKEGNVFSYKKIREERYQKILSLIEGKELHAAEVARLLGARYEQVHVDIHKLLAQKRIVFTKKIGQLKFYTKAIEIEKAIAIEEGGDQK
jgi:hypothetical protein